MSFSLKKAIKKVAPVVTGGLVGGQLFKGLGGPGPQAPAPSDPLGDVAAFNQFGTDSQKQLQEQAAKQQQQILDFANQYQTNAGNYRGQLAKSLADTAHQTFQQENPYILEDLNSRGLATSPTAVGAEQDRALKDIALQNQNVLSGFDTNTFNQLNDIRGSGLNTLLGGNQDALNAALQAKQAGLQRSFDVADQNRQQAFSNYLAKRQSRNQLTNSLIGAGGSILGGFLGGH
jgi:hypothetical protein